VWRGGTFRSYVIYRKGERILSLIFERREAVGGGGLVGKVIVPAPVGSQTTSSGQEKGVGEKEAVDAQSDQLFWGKGWGERLKKKGEFWRDTVTPILN